MLATDRFSGRGLRRLLKNPLLQAEVVMEPLARQELQELARHGQIVLLSMDQTDIEARSLALAWIPEQGAAHIGFEHQRNALEQVLDWLLTGAKVMLSADRYYRSAELFKWLGGTWDYCDGLPRRRARVLDSGACAWVGTIQSIVPQRSKKTHAQTDPNHWSFRKLYRSGVSWFKRELHRLKRCLQNDLPLVFL